MIFGAIIAIVGVIAIVMVCIVSMSNEKVYDDEIKKDITDLLAEIMKDEKRDD